MMKGDGAGCCGYSSFGDRVLSAGLRSESVVVVQLFVRSVGCVVDKVRTLPYNVEVLCNLFVLVVLRATW